MGKLLPYQDILITFASPIIMLFLEGFFLAMATTKYHLDVNLARVFLKSFVESPKFVLLSMMLMQLRSSASSFIARVLFVQVQISLFRSYFR